MSIYVKEDSGELVPVQVEQTIEDLLKTREVVEISPCVKENLNTLTAAKTKEVPVATSGEPK